jgi:hypothetical protein
MEDRQWRQKLLGRGADTWAGQILSLSDAQSGFLPESLSYIIGLRDDMSGITFLNMERQ